MTKEKIVEIELCYDIGYDFPDDAWWALCAEHGLDVHDLEAYWKMRGKINEPTA